MKSRQVSVNLQPGPIVAWPQQELMLEDCLLRGSLLRFGSGCQHQSYHDRLDGLATICCQQFGDGSPDRLRSEVSNRDWSKSPGRYRSRF